MTGIKTLLGRSRLVAARALSTVQTTATPVTMVAEKLIPVVTSHPIGAAVSGTLAAVRECSGWATGVLWQEFSANVGVRGWVQVIESTLTPDRVRCERMMDVTIYHGRVGNRTVSFRVTDTSRDIGAIRGEEDLVRDFFRERLNVHFGPVVLASRAGEIPNDFGGSRDSITIQDVGLHGMESPVGDEIAEYLGRLLDVVSHRSLLLYGRPGVGKSVMARYIASRLARGRIVVIDARVLENRELASGLSLLSPDVIIVDELDKVRPVPDVMDVIRSSARLVVYTANNGDDDTVIDGSLVRCGRVDVSREITDIGVSWDSTWLPEDLRTEVLGWPQAAQEEARIRFTTFGSAVDLSDIRTRVAMRCHSVKR